MAWLRWTGAASKSVVPLDPLGSLARSFTRWIKNSYITGIASDALFNPDYGGASFSGDTASITQTSGYAVGFVTRCEAGKTYSISFALSGTASGVRLRVMYFNGTSRTSYDDMYSSGVFTVPSSNVTDVVLVPIMSNNGTMTFSISSFTAV